MAYRLPLYRPPSATTGYIHFWILAYLPVSNCLKDWMAPVWASSPMVGFHSVNRSGGSPAAMALSSLASPSALGTLSTVTWTLDCDELNCAAICLLRVAGAPDHMFHQVMLTVPLPELAALLPVAMVPPPAPPPPPPLVAPLPPPLVAPPEEDVPPPQAASIRAAAPTADPAKRARRRLPRDRRP